MLGTTTTTITGAEDDLSTGMLPNAGNTSLMDGSFHSRSSFNAPGVGEMYDKTLFNLCYLIQMQIGIFFKQGKAINFGLFLDSPISFFTFINF